MDVEGAEARGAALDQVAADLARLVLGPHDGDVGDRAVRDPELGAVEDVVVPLPDGAGRHPARVGPVVGLGQPEAADRRALLELRQPPVLLRVGPEAMDGIHDEPALHRGEGAEPRVPALELLHDQPVGHVRQARAPVALEGRAEDAELAQLRHDRHGEGAGPVMLGDERQELGLDPVPDRVAHHPLLVREQGLDAVVVHAAELLHSVLSLGVLLAAAGRGAGPPLRGPGSSRRSAG